MATRLSNIFTGYIEAHQKFLRQQDADRRYPAHHEAEEL